MTIPTPSPQPSPGGRGGWTSRHDRPGKALARGFTLLEVMLATALTVLVMVGVLAVVADLGRSAWAGDAAQADMDHPGAVAPGTTNPNDADPAWEACVRLVREDLQNARRVHTDVAQQITLIGYGGLDAANRAVTHRPVQVTYRLEQIDGQSWLIRRQALLDVLTNQNVQRDLVWAGVHKWELTCLDVPQDPAGNSPVRASTDAATTAAPPAGSAARSAGGIAKGTSAAPAQATSRGGYSGGMPIINSPEYIEWLKAQEHEQTTALGAAAEATEATPPADAAAQKTTAEADEPPNMAEPTSGRVWRLRMWTDAGTQATYEKVITTR